MLQVMHSGGLFAVKKHVGSFAVVLLLLVAVHLVSWYRVPTSEVERLVHVDSVPVVLSKSASRTPNTTNFIIVSHVGNFTERISRFNVELERVRRDLRLRSRYNANWTDVWNSSKGNIIRSGKIILRRPWMRVIVGARDDYMDELRNNEDILTVAVSWSGTRSNWSSLTDVSNVLYQRYYQWTAHSTLCTWIETPRVIKMKYDAIYRRTCHRNISDTELALSLLPMYLNAKPINPHHYWPNRGNSYPRHFYTETPPYVFYMHIHRNAVVTVNGDVITSSSKLVLYGCGQDIHPTLPLGDKPLSKVPYYEEVYVISQHWGRGVFHRMAEIVPRLVLCRQFLSTYPEIRILAPEVNGGRLAELMKIIGLDPSRLVSGVTRAKVVYQPRATGCGFANVQESQMLPQLYRDYIKKTFPHQPRNKLILIRRSRSRKFAEQKRIEELLKRAASEYNLIYTLFIDNPTPSLNKTMMMFHSAVMIVAPHGAGETNMYFSEPGTYVVEGVCNLPHVNLCFLRLAHILGHHWHGVASRRGCERVVAVSAQHVESAVRNLLQLWNSTSSISR